MVSETLNNYTKEYMDWGVLILVLVEDGLGGNPKFNNAPCLRWS